MKKLLISTFAFVLLLNLANAESENGEVRRSVNNIKIEDRQEISDSSNFYTDNDKNIKPYLGITGNTNIDTQIKALRDSYIAKLKALQAQYETDLKNIVGTRTLTMIRDDKTLPLQASATATAAVNKDHPNDGKVEVKGFFNKIKVWLGFDN